MPEVQSFYAQILEADLVEQFKEQPHIHALLEVIGRQMDELYQFFADLRDKRALMTAEGYQLDGIGDIVKLDRMEAGELACVQEPNYVLDDEKYRELLMYKIWRNSNDTTYYSIIKSLRIFWDRPLYYSEDPEIPACMIFDTGEMEGLVDTSKLMLNPIIRAAGVGYRIRAVTSTAMEKTILWIKSGFASWSESTFEWIDRDIDYSTSVHWFNNYPTMAEDTLSSVIVQDFPIGSPVSIMETPLGEPVVQD